MRHGLAALTAALLFSGAAWAQGAGGGQDKSKLGEQLRKEAMAGGGYVKDAFLGDLDEALRDLFGDTKGGQLSGNLAGQKLSEKELTDLVNGDLTKSKIEDLFGCTRGETDKVEEAIDEAVDQKNRKMFFGILILILVVDMDLDPSGEFCQQVAGSRDQAPDDAFEKLLKGNVSKELIVVIFKFEAKADLSFMQDVLNQARGSPFCHHPLAKSMGMGDPAKWDPSQMPELEEGMPGFGGECPEMPPCPFLGENMGEIFESCKPPEEPPAAEGE